MQVLTRVFSTVVALAISLINVVIIFLLQILVLLLTKCLRSS